MKRRTKNRFIPLCVMLMMCFCTAAAAVEYDAAAADAWLNQFADALMQIPPRNDPAMTADPARAGQYLIEYEFGTVISRTSSVSCAEDILEIDLRTAQVLDCRGVSVGTPADQAEPLLPSAAGGQLYVISTQEAGYGWSWAYVGADGAYGVEYITYGDGDDAGAGLKEYTLTYILEGGAVSAIHMKMTDVTLAQAQDGAATAEEIAGRQQTGLLADRNQAQPLDYSDMTVMGVKALGDEVAHLVSFLGEPAEIQTLPGSAGRVLVYEGAAVRLSFDEYTGVEVVRGVSVSSPSIIGPNGLTVGMPVKTAASLFRCDGPVYVSGGELYRDGERYGRFTVSAEKDMLLTYACPAPNGETAVLEAGAAEGSVTYWHLYYLSDVSDAEGGI